MQGGRLGNGKGHGMDPHHYWISRTDLEGSRRWLEDEAHYKVGCGLSLALGSKNCRVKVRC